MRQSSSSSVEQAGDLVDERVVAARLEERLPVAARPFEEVLAAGRVGQHAVHVEDDRRAGCHLAVAPAPVVRLVEAVRHVLPRQSSCGAVAARSRISSTTPASASVVVSPRSRPSATSRSRRRMILPDRGLGQVR